MTPTMTILNLREWLDNSVYCFMSSPPPPTSVNKIVDQTIGLLQKSQNAWIRRERVAKNYISITCFWTRMFRESLWTQSESWIYWKNIRHRGRGGDVQRNKTVSLQLMLRHLLTFATCCMEVHYLQKQTGQDSHRTSQPDVFRENEGAERGNWAAAHHW